MPKFKLSVPAPLFGPTVTTVAVAGSVNETVLPDCVQGEELPDAVNVSVFEEVLAAIVIPLPAVNVSESLFPDAVIVSEPLTMLLNVLTDGVELEDCAVLVIVVPEIEIPLPAVRVNAPVCP